MNRLSCLLLILVAIIYSGNAQTPAGFNVVCYEGFNYASGSSLLNASGGSGWATNWTKSYQDRYLETGTVGFSYTGLNTTGLKAEFDSNCYGTCNDIASLGRSFPLQNEGIVYFQFISVFEASASGGTPTIRLYNGTTHTGTIGASTGSYMSILDASGNSSPSSASLSAQNLVVVRIDHNLNETKMWVNPNLATFDYLNPVSPSASIANFAPAFNRFDIFIRSGSIDEITIYKEKQGLNKFGKKDAYISQGVNKNGKIGSGNGVNSNGQIISSANNGLSAASAGTSALQIKTDFPNATDGLYWISNPNINGGTPFQIYADMTTDGGGWTLIMKNSNSAGWNYSNAISLNTSIPFTNTTDVESTITPNYSIIGWANFLKKSASGFQYMIDAGTRRSHGGIWTANGDYSFVKQDNSQTNITLNTKFGTWEYYESEGIGQRMPWYQEEGQCGTITTDNGGGNWWGTLVSTCNGWNPTPWIGNGNGGTSNPNPTIIWYWVR